MAGGLPRTQRPFGIFGGWRKGSWGGRKTKNVEPSLVPLRANRQKFLGARQAGGHLGPPSWILFFSPKAGTPYNVLYREAVPERGTLFRLEICKRPRVGVSRCEV